MQRSETFIHFPPVVTFTGDLENIGAEKELIQEYLGQRRVYYQHPVVLPSDLSPLIGKDRFRNWASRLHAKPLSKFHKRRVKSIYLLESSPSKR